MPNDVMQNIATPFQKMLYYMTGGPIEKAMGMSPIIEYPQEPQAPQFNPNTGSLPSAWEKANQESRQQQLHQMKKPLPKGK